MNPEISKALECLTGPAEYAHVCRMDGYPLETGVPLDTPLAALIRAVENVVCGDTAVRLGMPTTPEAVVMRDALLALCKAINGSETQ
jgi:hypothetical protein